MSIITCNNISQGYKDFPIYFHTTCDRHQQETVKRPYGMPGFHQILIVLDGKGCVKHKNCFYELKKGSAFFIASGVPVEYINENGLVTCFLTAKGSAVNDLMRCFNCDGFLYYESVNQKKYVLDIERIISNYYEQKREGILSAMVYSFYMDFFEEQNCDFTPLDEVVLYIEKNFSKKLTLAQLANIGNFSVSKLCHDFKSKFNCSVFQYVLNLRLNYARQLFFLNPSTLIKEVAVLSGFDDVSYFCRSYRAKFGKSPSEDKNAFL